MSEGGADAHYTVALDADPATILRISVEAGDSQVNVLPTVLEFTTADWNQERVVTATAVDDDFVEGLAESTITHAVEIADSNYTWAGEFSPSENVTVRIYDNDQAGVVLSTSSLYINEGGLASYTAWLMGSPSSNVEVRWRDEASQILNNETGT